MAAACAFGDDQQPGGRLEQFGGHFSQISAPRALFSEITRDDAHMAGLEQIANRLPESSRAAIEGNFDVLGLRMPHGATTRVFMTTVEVKQSSAFEQFRLKTGSGVDDGMKTI
jgi:hypothetical protein